MPWTSLGRLVLTARGISNFAGVGLAFDNNSSLGQWKFVQLGSNFKRGMYVLRHTENTGKPMCLASCGSAVVLECNSGQPGQRWTLAPGTALVNDSGRAIQPPSNPILVSNLFLGPEFGSQHFERRFNVD